ncbi:MAG TPA: CCA tRNA nucleotidyltransferase [Stellaceae bacterium]|nr:CCA tRNA nucleotidyltransferase [Stellaceae bacterium]
MTKPRTWPPTWIAVPETRALIAALDAAGIAARFVGGAVRDSLLGRPSRAIDDIDMATPARPEAVLAALGAARIRAVPTGLAHGTVTAVFPAAKPPRRFEITTLRRDVETDGRHAVVAFDADWAGDAARRDFTINAIYLLPDGAIFDPVGGRADLAARRVRFVGDADRRLREDVLRLLRYYRFEARFGRGPGDAVARAACRAAVPKLATLSAERVAHELLGLIAAPRPARALRLMRDDGVLAAVLADADRIDRLVRLVRMKVTDPLLRLAALVTVDAAAAQLLGERLRLARAERDRLVALAPPVALDPAADDTAQRCALYRLGAARYRDAALLIAAEGQIAPPRLARLLDLAARWVPPVFPINGADVAALGVSPGPEVGRLLAAVRRWWEKGDFTADRTECLARLRELV